MSAFWTRAIGGPFGSPTTTQPSPSPTPSLSTSPTSPSPTPTQQRIIRGVEQIAAPSAGGGSTPSQPLTDIDRDAEAYLRELLGRWGLESLAPQVLQWLRQGRSATEIEQLLRDTREFKERFPAIPILEEMWRQGVPVWVPTPEEYVRYERDARDLMLAAGMPSTFYDERGDFTDLIVGQISLPRLATRIQEGFARVNQAAQEVREVFGEFFGPQGDAALAAFFLDPERAEDDLVRFVTTAEAGGAGRVHGFDVGLGAAERIGQMGFGFSQALGGFGQAATLRPLTRDLTFERGALTEESLIGGTFGIEQDAEELIRRRQEGRLAQFEGGGRAMIGSGGIAAGAARR